MPSPFPGMDPFLEHPYFFPDLHSSLIYCIRQTLQRSLPPPYYEVLNDRLWVEMSERLIEPDVDVLVGASMQRARATSSVAFEGTSTEASTATAEPVVISIDHDERRETFVDIMTRTDMDERIVTTIEILSLTNKTPGERGRSLYLRKQGEILDSKINLVEIDLLRAGEHSTAVPLRKAIRWAGRFDYHVCIASVEDPISRTVYGIKLQQRLPSIKIPLIPGDDPIALDLQAVFDLAYDDGPYRRRVPYELDRIVPPLTAEQTAWAAERLKDTVS